MQLSRNISDAWLAHWVTDTTLDGNTNVSSLDHVILKITSKDDNSSTTAHTTGYYLGVFAGLAAANSIFTMARAFLFAYAGIKAAKIIHNKLLNKVMFVSIFSIHKTIIYKHFLILGKISIF